MGSVFPVCAPERAASADWRTDTLFDCTAMSVGWHTWLRGIGEQLPERQRVHLASTYAVGFSAAERGSALSMMLDVFAASALTEGRLVQPFDHTCPVNESYWLVEQPERHRSDAARAFASWILERVGARNPDVAVEQRKSAPIPSL